MNCKALIFDLDGTLVSSLTDIADAVNYSLCVCGYPTHPYESYKHFVGQGIRNLVKSALPKGVTDRLIDSVLSIFINYYKQHLLDKTELYPGIDELLNHLSNTDIKLTVLSNKAHDLTLTIVDRLLADWKFDIVLGASENMKRKPDPEAALYIAQQLNLPVEDVVMIGDSRFDIETAKAAGMLSVGVAWGFRSKEELQSVNADYIIDRPDELIKIIGR